MSTLQSDTVSFPANLVASNFGMPRLLRIETALHVGYVEEADCLAVRKIGLLPAQAKPVPAYPDAREQFHLAAFIGLEIASVATFLLEVQSEDQGCAADYSCWRLRAMATHPNHRNLGYATAVLEHGVRLLNQRRASLLWANGRSTAMGFYLRNGFYKIGEQREVPGVPPHYRIERRLSAHHEK